MKWSSDKKEIQNLKRSIRKLEESLMKADREYRYSNIKTEQCRLKWEAAMYHQNMYACTTDVRYVNHCCRVCTYVLLYSWDAYGRPLQ